MVDKNAVLYKLELLKAKVHLAGSWEDWKEISNLLDDLNYVIECKLFGKPA